MPPFNASMAIALVASVMVSSGCSPDPHAGAPVITSLTSPAAPGSAEPNLAADADGRVYMSWLEPAGAEHALRFAVLDDTTWSQARTIRQGSDFFVNWADFPSIEVLGDGRLAAHWLQRSGPGTYAYGVRLATSDDDGESWSTPIMPHRDSSQTEHGFVAMWREAGQLGAVWLDGRKFGKPGHDAANEMMLMSTTLGPDGSLGEEVPLDARTCDCCQNSAAMTADGPIVAYRDRTPDEIRDIYITRRVGGRWTEGTAVHPDGWQVDFCPVNGPAIVADDRQVAVAWFTAARDSARVKVAFSDDAGATFSAPTIVDDGSPAGRVDIALLEDGSALITWIERTGGDTAAVRARRVAPDGTRHIAVTIAASSAERASGFPRMAISGEDVVFAWTVPGKPSAVRVARARAGSFE